ncbi:FtsX-like permease family protein [Actinomadura sp. SCN-SB]|uniref:ABC transporter permease n=1 Tax=Actinomadura sp. SCN-SB TaxID=3373092 RepID=UPI003750DE6A
MFGLAVRSLRKRAGGFAASFVAMFLGATMVMAFGAMQDTAISSDATGAAEETLVTMSIVVGGWGSALVILAVSSTLALSVRQRAEEMALLKSVGATPAQIGRMVVGEATGLALVAWLLAIGPGLLGGAALLSLLHSTDQVPESVPYAFGPVALGIGLTLTLVSAVASAIIAVTRIARAGVIRSLADAAVGRTRMSRKRVAFGIVFLLLGLNLAVVTATVMKDEGMDAMATAGQADIMASLGLALLAPWLIRWAAGVLSRPLELLFGVAGELAVSTLRRRTAQMASVLMPIILFTGVATGSLYLQQIENDATAAAGLVSTVEQKNIATLNFVVIGMILLFTAVILVNTLLAATAYRRGEFGRQRLVGATRGQVVGAVALEAAVLIGLGLVCGVVAAMFTVVPFSVARADALVPDIGPLVFVAVALIATALTAVTAITAAHRAAKISPVEAASL